MLEKVRLFSTVEKSQLLRTAESAAAAKSGQADRQQLLEDN
jgi:hypothetical protein